MEAEKKYKKLTRQLLDEINNRLEDDLFLTVYLPIESETQQARIRKRIKQRLKSAILTTFKNNPKIKVHKLLPQRIVELANEKVNSFEKFYSGIGLFCQFGQQKPKDLTISQFIKPPQEETFIGKTYDLDQLIWITNTATKALVISINQKQAQVYVMGNSQLKKIYHQKNEFLDTRIKDLQEYIEIEKRNLSTGGKTFYGTGTRTVENETTLANQLFLNQVIEFIQQEKHLKTSFDHLVIFYTYPFTKLIDNLVEQSFIKTNFKPFLVTENTQTKKEIQDITIKNIDQYQQKRKLQFLQKAKKNHELFVEGWSEVVPNARQKKLAFLFIPPKSRKEGYIGKNNKLWLNPKNEVKKIDNIAPWLVKSVSESNGKILVIRDNEYLNKVEVAAQLRF